MADIGALYVRILADMKTFGVDLRSKMAGASAQAEGAGRKTGGGFVKGLAAATAAVGAIAAVKFVEEAGKSASELQSDMEKTKGVFGSAGESVVGWSKKSAGALGLSQDAALTLSNNLGNLYKSYGLSGKGAADLSEKSITLGNDLATFYKKDPAAGVNAIRMASAGAYRGLRQFGIVITAAQVNAQALSMGLGKTTVDTTKLAAAQRGAEKAQLTYNAAVAKHGKNSLEARKASLALQGAQANVNKVMATGKTTLTAAEKATATYALIQNKAGAASGAFRKEGNTLEVQQRKTAAQFANTKAQLGNALLPVMTMVGKIIATQIAPAFAKLAEFISKNSKWLTPLVGVMGGFVLVLLAVGKAAKVAKAAQEGYQTVLKTGKAIVDGVKKAWALFNIVLDSNPIIIVVIAIVALIAILVIAYLKIGWFRNAVNAAFGAIKTAVMIVFDFVKTHWPLIVGILLGPIGIVILLFIRFRSAIIEHVAGAASWVLSFLRTNWPLIVGILLGPVALAIGIFIRWRTQIIGLVWGAFSAVFSLVSSIMGSVVGYLSGAVGRIIGFFSGLPGRLYGIGSSMMTSLLNGITAAWSAVSGWLSGVPGRAAGAITGAATALYSIGTSLISGIVNGIKDAWSTVTSTISSLASHLPGPLKKVLGIGSPSKVMANEIGQWISKGIASGISDHAGSVHAALAGLPLDVYAHGGAGGAVPAGAGRKRGAYVENMYVQALDARQLASAVADKLAYQELRGAII
jgi:hypothetical protein